MIDFQSKEIKRQLSLKGFPSYSHPKAYGIMKQKNRNKVNFSVSPFGT